MTSKQHSLHSSFSQEQRRSPQQDVVSICPTVPLSRTPPSSSHRPSGVEKKFGPGVDRGAPAAVVQPPAALVRVRQGHSVSASGCARGGVAARRGFIDDHPRMAAPSTNVCLVVQGRSHFLTSLPFFGTMCFFFRARPPLLFFPCQREPGERPLENFRVPFEVSARTVVRNRLYESARKPHGVVALE